MKCSGMYLGVGVASGQDSERVAKSHCKKALHVAVESTLLAPAALLRRPQHVASCCSETGDTHLFGFKRREGSQKRKYAGLAAVCYKLEGRR